MPKKDLLKNLNDELHGSVSGSELRKKRTSELNLEFRFDTERQKLLKSRGVDGHAFSFARAGFNIEDSLVRIRPDIKWLPEDFVIKSISVRKQALNLEKVLNNPLRGNYIAAIGSYPSDSRAKLVAANIMNQAMSQQMKGVHRGRAYPLWHKVFGGRFDPIRDSREHEHLSMIVLSNVSHDSTPDKLEKLRDLLEKFDSIPRIVVVNGGDPVTFFAEKVRMPLNYAFYISAEQKASIMDI